MKPTIKQRKALRRAAALKGWETRRAMQTLDTLHFHAAIAEVARNSLAAMRPPPDPNPWPKLSRWIRTLWAKITGTA